MGEKALSQVRVCGTRGVDEKRNAEPCAGSGQLVGEEGYGKVGGSDSEGQLVKEPNPGQLVGEYQETEKNK